MTNFMRYAKSVAGLSLVLLFARCVHVVDEPIGKRNPLDKTFIALSGLFIDAGKYDLISYENLITRGVFNSLQDKIAQHRIAEYTEGLLGKGTSIVGDKFWLETFKAFSILKDHPRGTKENSYSEDELRAFYISIIQDPYLAGGTDIKERSLSYSVQSLAKIAYDKVSTGYISIVDGQIRLSGSDKTESEDIKDFKVEFTGNANPTLADIACRYVALSQSGVPSGSRDVYFQIAGKYVKHYSGNSTVRDIQADLRQNGVVCPR